MQEFDTEYRKLCYIAAEQNYNDFMCTYKKDDSEEDSEDYNYMLQQIWDNRSPNPIKMWRKNANLTQNDISCMLGIPKRTLEDYETNKSLPAEWVEKLLVEKLMKIACAEIEKNGRRYANSCKSDENGNRPVLSWVAIEHDEDNSVEHIEFCSDMSDAIKSAEHIWAHLNDYERKRIKVDVAYITCNSVNGELLAWYEDKNGDVKTDHDSLEKFISKDKIYYGIL